MLARIFLLLCISKATLAEPESTVYPFQFEPPEGELKTLIIASQNLGKPSRKYLTALEESVDRTVNAYLRDHGFKVLSSRIYAQALSKAEARLGDPFDPTTGKLNQQRKQQVLADVFKQLQASQPGLDGVVFTELLDRRVYFSSGMKRAARWDGVSRAPELLGAGRRVTTDFDWTQPVDAVSIGIYVFTIEGQSVLVGVGGMSLTQAIDTRGNGSLQRSRNMLSNETQILEGIQLAFHPWITMDDYPGGQ